MIEDDLYRSSTQYRKWSFTPSQLAAQRNETNAYAAAKVRAAFERAGSAKNGDGEANGTTTTEGDGLSFVDTLTAEEELKIVEWGCGKIQEMGGALRCPKGLIATAIQYLRRFYLTNSPMTYHPKSIMACCLYLATKSSHYHLSPSAFTAEFANLSEDDLKAPEFLLLQGLQFTLDVRHPFMGLDGGWIEMQGMIEREELLPGVHDAEKRGLASVQKAKAVLRREAQMTDAYFLYSPAQIWVAGVWAVDEELARGYLGVKLGEVFGQDGGDDAGGGGGSAAVMMSAEQKEAMKGKIIGTIDKCAEVLKAWKSPEDDKKERKELARIGKKLAKCQDPEKADIVAVARAKKAEKREGSESEREEKAKKRKLEQERRDADSDVFGGELKDVKRVAANGD